MQTPPHFASYCIGRGCLVHGPRVDTVRKRSSLRPPGPPGAVYLHDMAGAGARPMRAGNLQGQFEVHREGLRRQLSIFACHCV